MCGTRNYPVFIPPTGDMASPYYAKSIQPEALKHVPQDPAAFATFITNFHLGRGHHRFRVPHFGGAELNLFALFDEVINRGGCLSVMQIKGWREVVRPYLLHSIHSRDLNRTNRKAIPALRRLAAYMWQPYSRLQWQQVHHQWGQQVFVDWGLIRSASVPRLLGFESHGCLHHAHCPNAAAHSCRSGR
jgi:hypothetical protein